MQVGVDACIAVGWIAFWIYWLVAAVGVKKGRIPWRHFAGVRLVIILLVLLLVRLGAFHGQAVTHDPWREVVGLAIFASGLATAVWARRQLGRNWGSPMSRKVDPDLVTTGPYRWVRHPIYSGLVVAVLGTAVAVSWYWLIVVAMVGAYFAYSAIVEERELMRRFPDTYPAYRHSTKMLIPFVL